MINAPTIQNEVTEENCNIQKKYLTFKDWKTFKDAQDKAIEKLENKRNGMRNVNLDVNSKHFGPANGLNFNKNFRGSCNLRLNSCGPPTNNCFNNFNNANHFNRRSNFDSYNIATNFQNSEVPGRFTNFNNLPTFSGKYYQSSNISSRGNSNVKQSENTFTSDCVYVQRDMMQKPLRNPFRHGGQNVQLYQQFQKNSKSNKTTEETKFQSSNNYSEKKCSADTMKPKEPEVYIKNPEGNSSNPYIPKPKMPEQNSDLTYEEKKQQWKEYRKAMKPFKNRDFYNAKRVVQRLGKKAPCELNEKELLRLKNSQECMAAHKDRLNAKYPKYVKAEDTCNDLGELYILKTQSTNLSNFASDTEHIPSNVLGRNTKSVRPT